MTPRDYSLPTVFVWPGLEIESRDGDTGRVWIDDDKALREALDEDGIDEELIVALFERMALTGDYEAPEWLYRWAEDKGCIEDARDRTTPVEPMPSEADFARFSNPSMVEETR